MAEGNIGRRYACHEPYDLTEMKKAASCAASFEQRLFCKKDKSHHGMNTDDTDFQNQNGSIELFLSV
jgi:hypothetical protein